VTSPGFTVGVRLEPALWERYRAKSECFDIFSPPPGDSDVISQVERLSGIHIGDLAAFIDEQRAKALKECEQLSETSTHLIRHERKVALLSGRVA